MKRSRITGIGIILGLLAFAAAPTLAQDVRPMGETERPGVDGQQRGGGAPELQRLRQAIGELDLSREQRAEVNAILRRTMTDLRDRRDELLALPPAERRRQTQQIFATLREEVSAQLTPEQRTALQNAIQAQGRPTPTDRPRQGDRSASAPPNPPPQPPGPFLQRVQANLDQLNLTNEQRAKVDPVLTTAIAEIAPLRDAIVAGDEEARAQAGVIVRDAREQIQALLTPQQRQALRRMQGERLMDAAQDRQQRWRAPATGPTSLGEPTGPGEGDPMPAASIALEQLDGPPVELGSLRGKAALLVFGSYTSPSFRERSSSIDELRERHQRRGLQVFVVYAREAHAQDEWEVSRNREDGIVITQPTSPEERAAVARQARDQLPLRTPILLDTMDDAAAGAFAASANSAVLIGRDGTIRVRQEWFDPYALEPHIAPLLNE